ncbi:unnamed protein product [Hermetia illucens]|uniref:Tektin n=1 Tax=Hermetia illucens TaxID=343691 RepID=A0A7R8YTD3_HERIL|nr:tektin-1 [Hermetia illucens]CAD7083520.1 unnamed protein product [Hermetia illucens]
MDSVKYRMLGAHLANENLIITSLVPPRHTINEWNENLRFNTNLSEAQEKLGHRVLSEADALIEGSRIKTQQNKEEVDFRTKQRIEEIKFLIDELKKQKQVALIEEESLKVYRQRIMNAIDALKVDSLRICNQCIMLRENRLGIELVDDQVDRTLRHELKVIQGCQVLMDRTLQETTEQIRRLRATIYLLDRDLSNKDISLQIDESNLLLRENQMEMSVYRGKIPLERCATNIQEWEYLTNENIQNTAKELNSATQLRTYVDILLQQVIDDLKEQTNKTNEAFQCRIDEIKSAKKVLESIHYQTVNEVNEIGRKITDLERALAEKEGYLALCQMRTANRAQRPGMESTCDAVQDALRDELNDLNKDIANLNQMIAEAKASQRYLLHCQVLQEEEINNKTNSLKIDEVDCMTLRQGLLYNSF